VLGLRSTHTETLYAPKDVLMPDMLFHTLPTLLSLTAVLTSTAGVVLALALTLD
jgi:hypothetical protein